MIRIPQNHLATPDIDGVITDAAQAKLAVGAALSPPVPAVSSSDTSPIPSREEMEQLARLDDIAGIVRDEDGTVRNRADLAAVEDLFEVNDAKIATKQAAIKVKQQSMAQLEQIAAGTQPDREGAPPQSLKQVQEAQVAELAQSVMSDAVQADDEGRAQIEEHGAALIEDHDAAAKAAANKARKQQAKQLAQQSIDTSINYAATLVDEPEARARELFELEQEVAEQGALEGWTAEKTDEEQAKARAQVHERIIDKLIADDPARARNWLTAEQAKIGADQMASLGFKIDLQEQAAKIDKLNTTYLEADEQVSQTDYLAAAIDQDGLADLSTEQQAAVRARANSGYAALLKTRQEQKSQTHLRVSDDVNGGKVDPEDVKVLTEGQQVNVMMLKHKNDQAAQQGRARETDPAVFATLFGKGWQSFIKADLIDLRHKLSDDDYQTLLTLKQQYDDASSRDKKRIAQYFANLSDLAARGGKYSAQLNIIESGLHEFQEASGALSFERQIDILDNIARAYQVPLLGGEEVGKHTRSVEQIIAENQRSVEADPLLPLTIEEEDAHIDGIMSELGGESLAATLGISEKDLRNQLKIDLAGLRESFPIELAGEKRVGQYAEFRPGKLLAFIDTAAGKLGRDFQNNISAKPDAVRAALDAIGHLTEEGAYLSEEARARLKRKLMDDVLGSLMSRDVLVDTVDRLGKVGASGGGVIGASVGAMLAAGCGPLILACVLPATIAGGVVGSIAGETAGRHSLSWLEDEALPFMRGLLD